MVVSLGGGLAAFLGVLRLLGGSLGVAEAPPGVLRVGMGSFEAPPLRILREGGEERLDKPLPVAVAPSAFPSRVAPPPEVFLMGTGSLDFQAPLAPVPRTCLVGGAATPPWVPANTSAVAGGDGCLPLMAAAAVAAAIKKVVCAMCSSCFEQSFIKVLAEVKFCLCEWDGARMERRDEEEGEEGYLYLLFGVNFFILFGVSPPRTCLFSGPYTSPSKIFTAEPKPRHPAWLSFLSRDLDALLAEPKPRFLLKVGRG